MSVCVCVRVCVCVCSGEERGGKGRVYNHVTKLEGLEDFCHVHL